MIASIYFHRERTIVGRWSMEDVPVLHALDLLPAVQFGSPTLAQNIEAIKRAVEGCGSVRCAVPLEGLARHAYPVAPDDDHWTRRTFEIQVALSAVMQDGDSVLDYRLPWRYNGFQWHTLILIAQAVKQGVDTLSAVTSVDHAVCAPGAEMVSIAQTARIRQQSILGVTRRGDVWETYGVDAFGKPGLWRCIDVDTSMDTATQVVNLVQDTAVATSRAFDSVLLGGDHLTPALVEDVRMACQALRCRVERHQPFNHVRAATNDDLRAQALRIGHVLAPLVGLVLTAEPPLSIPCASLPAR